MARVAAPAAAPARNQPKEVTMPQSKSKNKNKSENKIIIGCLCAIGCETIFGLSYIFTKQATNIASSLTLLSWRFVLAFLIMSICVAAGAIKINLKGKNLKPIIIVAIFDPIIYFVGETVGIGSTTASESGAFLACIPVASLIASTLVLKKKPNRPQTVGICITLAGVLMTVFAVGLTASFSVIGYMMLTVAVIAYALYGVYVEKATAFTGAEITYIMLAAGAAAFAFCAIIEGCLKGQLGTLATLPFRNMDFLTAVLYQAVGCSILAFFLSNVAIANIGMNRTASFIGISTVVSIAAGILWLHENFTAWQLVGAAVIIAGVYIANIKQKEARDDRTK
ncbi:DMT family transporter [Aminicella lysinilytica]|uniref:Drug/metabolite transporter (DMT)-like permease n=1 Tax=Aminicella lysinilytica TaxID=433323 RepID=A0A4R6PX92_9FIRM|nr:DMT family transporter [Aminicella lysinilytica]TDP50336.1 drug/metabolite transporter (DMT)-like permease [Aminicella lysinilytica]